MGRVLGVLADLLAVARAGVELEALWRERRRDGGTPQPQAGGDRGRPDQPKQADSGEAPAQGGP